MITKEQYTELYIKVEKIIEDAFQKAKINNYSNYILFLANADYSEKIQKYIIDNRIDGFKDANRLRFLNIFLNNYYNFSNGATKIEDDFYRMAIELMVYCHIWESKPFLQKLYRFSKIVKGENYPQKLKKDEIVPNMKKREYIANKIKPNFNKDIVDLIEKGFHSSIRNAFAHSEYSFDIFNRNKRIILHNYKKEKEWALPYISFDEWTKRFCYSFLLTYHFLSKCYEKRKELTHNKPLIGNDKMTIIYDSVKDSFYHKKN